MLMLANVGLPMLLVYGPVLIVALVPIAVVECLWIRKVIAVSFARSFWSVLGANAVSTFVGVPLVWVVLVVVQLTTDGGVARGADWLAVTRQAAWLMPYEDEMHWMIPAAALTLTVPFCIVSAAVETAVLRRMFRSADRSVLRRRCWLGNITSYGLLSVFWGLQLLWGLVREGSSV